MKLSEAIRLGAMLKPQTFGRISGPVDGPRLPGDVLGLRFALGTCALGAAYDAGWLRQREDVGVHDAPMYCPACGQWSYADEVDALVNHIVMHLNDEHRWTREQIADWVESVEHRLAAPAVTGTSTEADCAEILPSPVL